MSNYRLSLLSIFDKIIEKLMHKWIYNFNSSTSSALIQITEKFMETIDNLKYVRESTLSC